jgi:hypothetical protein
VEAGVCLCKMLKTIPLSTCLASESVVQSFVGDVFSLFEKDEDPMSSTASLALLLFDCCFGASGRGVKSEKDAQIRAEIMMLTIKLGLPQRLVPLLGRSGNKGLFDLHWELAEIYAQVVKGQRELLKAGIMKVMLEHIRHRHWNSIRHIGIVIKVSLSVTSTSQYLFRVKDHGTNGFIPFLENFHQDLLRSALRCPRPVRVPSPLKKHFSPERLLGYVECI